MSSEKIQNELKSEGEVVVPCAISWWIGLGTLTDYLVVTCFPMLTLSFHNVGKD